MARRRAWIVALAVFLPAAIFHLAYFACESASPVVWGIPVVYERLGWAVVATGFSVFLAARWMAWMVRSVIEALEAVRRADRTTGFRRQRCPSCGYDLAGLVREQCPECGLELPGLRYFQQIQEDLARERGQELRSIIDRLHTGAPGRRCVVCRSELTADSGGRCACCGSAYSRETASVDGQ